MSNNQYSQKSSEQAGLKRQSSFSVLGHGGSSTLASSSLKGLTSIANNNNNNNSSSTNAIASHSSNHQSVLNEFFTTKCADDFREDALPHKQPRATGKEAHLPSYLQKVRVQVAPISGTHVSVIDELQSYNQMNSMFQLAFCVKLMVFHNC
jgi:hypothetical protein